MDFKQIGISLVIGVILGAGLYYKLGPSKETVKTQVVEDDVTKNNIKSTTTETDKPDGTKQIVTTTVDNSVKSVDISTKKNDIIVSPESTGTKKWHVSVGYLKDVTNLNDNIYQLSIERNIIGPFSLGVMGTSNKEVGLQLGFDF